MWLQGHSDYGTSPQCCPSFRKQLFSIWYQRRPQLTLRHAHKATKPHVTFSGPVFVFVYANHDETPRPWNEMLNKLADTVILCVFSAQRSWPERPCKDECVRSSVLEYNSSCITRCFWFFSLQIYIFKDTVLFTFDSGQSLEQKWAKGSCQLWFKL